MGPGQEVVELMMIARILLRSAVPTIEKEPGMPRTLAESSVSMAVVAADENA
jgi:hypothetical protein